MGLRAVVELKRHGCWLVKLGFRRVEDEKKLLKLDLKQVRMVVDFLIIAFMLSRQIQQNKMKIIMR